LTEATEGKTAASYPKSAPFQAAVIDVLIRGLETAKQRIEAGEGIDLEATWCTAGYYDSGHGWCTALYYHPLK